MADGNWSDDEVGKGGTPEIMMRDKGHDDGVLSPPEVPQ